MKNKLFITSFILIILITGCSKKSIEIKEWAQFQDPILKISFKYPKDWTSPSVEPTRVIVSSSAEAAEKFFDRDPRKKDGVQVIIASEASTETKDYEIYINDFRITKIEEGFHVSAVEDAVIDGLPAKQFTYAGAYDENIKIKTLKLAVTKDSVIYYVQYSALNDLYEPYKPIFDSILTSLTLPKKIKLEKGADPAVPMAELEHYSDQYFEFNHPANFGVNDMPKKGETITAIRLMGKLDGARRDCTIDFDIRPAKKLSLEKVVEQNTKFFKVVSKGETKIGGEKSIYLNYTPQMKNINSRIYFVVKNDKIYRVIFNYYAPMKKDFLPAFEKVVASMRIK